jgi:CD63 antigen
MVQLSCGVQCTRTLLFALNLLFLLLGFTVMGLGIYVKVNGNFNSIAEIYSVSEALGGEAMQWVGTGMIVAGIATACLAAFGCLGAFLHNRVFLYVYAVFLTLIILLEFAAVIVTLVFRNDLWKSYDSGFMELFHQSYSHNHTEAIKIIENLEQNFQCCGVDGAVDYLKYSYKIPLSCYPDQSLMKLPFNKGCAEAVAIWVWNELPIIAGVLGSILFIEIFGVISSLVLGVAISHSSNSECYDEL